MMQSHRIVIGDKKLLHKVRKNWVVVSAAVLSLLGAGYIGGQSSHANADTVSGNQNTNVSSSSINHPNINVANKQIASSSTTGTSSVSQLNTKNSASQSSSSNSSNDMSTYHVASHNLIGDSSSNPQYNVTVQYVNQHGHNVGWRNDTTSQDVTQNPAAFYPIPKGYILNSDQQPSEDFKGNDRTYTYNVTGDEIKNSVSVNLVKEHYTNDKNANPIWQSVNYNGPINGSNVDTISIPVTGRVGDFYSVSRIPANDVPAGYTVDTNNQPIIGEITPNGISQSVGTFGYLPDKAQILFNLVNSNDYAIMPSVKLSGYVDDAGWVSNVVKLPKGYHFDAGDSQTFRMPANNTNQIMDLRINGDQFTPDASKYSHQITARFVDQSTGKSLGSKVMSVNLPSTTRYGDTYKIYINPNNVEPANYVADGQPYMETVRFDPDGVKLLDPQTNLFEPLNKVHLQFDYIRNDGAQEYNNTNLPLYSADSSDGNASGNGASQLVNIGIKYVDQHGKTLSNATKAVATGKQNLTQLLSVPAGYSLVNSSNAITNVNSNGGDYTLNVVGNQIQGNVSVTLQMNAAKNDKYASSANKTKVITIPVSGKVGDSYSISSIPASDMPSGYRPDSSNKDITGTFTKTGISNNKGTFKYDPEPATLTLKIVKNKSNQLVENPIVYHGNAGDTGSIASLLGRISKGYTLINPKLGSFDMSGKNLNQTINIPVEGELINPGANYNHTIVFGLDEKVGNNLNQIGTANVIVPVPNAVRLGDSVNVPVNPSNLASSIYQPVTDKGDCQVVFGKNGIELVDPNTGGLVSSNALSLEYVPAGSIPNSNNGNNSNNSSNNSNSSNNANNNSDNSNSNSNVNKHTNNVPNNGNNRDNNSNNNDNSKNIPNVPNNSGNNSNNSSNTNSNSNRSSITPAQFAAAFQNLMNSDVNSKPSWMSNNTPSANSNDSLNLAPTNEFQNNLAKDLDSMDSINASDLSKQLLASATNSKPNNFVSGNLEFVGPNGNIISTASIGGTNGSQYKINIADPAISQNMPKGYQLANDVIQNGDDILRSGQNNSFRIDVEPVQKDSLSYIRLTKKLQLELKHGHSHLANLKPGRTFKVLGTRKAKNGRQNYLVKYGKWKFYVNSKYAQNAYYQPSEVKSGDYVEILKPKLYSYNSMNMNRHHIANTLWQNQIVKVDGAINSNGVTYLELTNGNYITGNRNIVSKFTLSR